MPQAIASPSEQYIEWQTRALADCPQCGALKPRACYALLSQGRGGPPEQTWMPASHTGRVRIAMTHPSWSARRPKLDIQPDCEVCATGDPVGHSRITLRQRLAARD